MFFNLANSYYQIIGLPQIRDNVLENKIFYKRITLAIFLVFFLMLVIVGRLFYLQVINHDRFNLLSESNRIRLLPLAPARGLIYDRSGIVLAENLTSYHLEITPEQVEDLEKLITIIKTRINISDNDIERFFKIANHNPRYNAIPLRFQLTDEEIARLAVDMYRLPGVEIRADLQRHYPMKSFGVHAIGYVGRIDESDLHKLDSSQYSGSTHIGKIGIERFYENILHGQTGYEEVETNAEGRSLRVLKHIPPISGRNIYLSLDVRLQTIAENALSGQNGAIVAIDPRNGEILALASQPIYDPNQFVNGIDNNNYRLLSNSLDKPLLNRAIRGVYPPGSTIKPLMALAGLEYGTINRNSNVFCTGSYKLSSSGRKFRDWKRGGHGNMNLEQAIAQSCDVYFYDLAINLGIEKIHNFLDKFCIGRPTGVDLFGEKGALLPSKEWKMHVQKQDWFGGDTVSVGIGQGFFLVTPLQLAHLTAIIAQRGNNYQPRMLYAIQNVDSRNKSLIEPRALPPIILRNSTNWDAIVNGMVNVIESGTAHKIKSYKYQIAGKTGTSQVFTLNKNEKYNPKRLPKNLLDHALFIAFAPVNDPRIAVAVISEHGGNGSTNAAPLAKKVIDAYLLGNYKINDKSY